MMILYESFFTQQVLEKRVKVGLAIAFTLCKVGEFVDFILSHYKSDEIMYHSD